MTKYRARLRPLWKIQNNKTELYLLRLYLFLSSSVPKPLRFTKYIQSLGQKLYLLFIMPDSVLCYEFDNLPLVCSRFSK